MAMEVDIAIVGGGLGGLALALGLQERGIQAHVFEKAPKVRGRSGTAISLGQNGTTPQRNLAAFSFSSQILLACAEMTSPGGIQNVEQPRIPAQKVGFHLWVCPRNLQR